MCHNHQHIETIPSAFNSSKKNMLIIKNFLRHRPPSSHKSLQLLRLSVPTNCKFSFAALIFITTSFHLTKWFSCLSCKLIIAPRFLVWVRHPRGAERHSGEGNKIEKPFGETTPLAWWYLDSWHCTHWPMRLVLRCKKGYVFALRRWSMTVDWLQRYCYNSWGQWATEALLESITS